MTMIGMVFLEMIFLIKALLLVASYFVGSVPTGYWFANCLFGVDVTKKGSGNIGATNVARVLGDKRFFFGIFFLDFLKAAGFLWICKYFAINFLGLDFLFILAVGLLLGNSYSIFLGFNGGKGVATTLGILAVLYSFKFILIFLIPWLFVLLIVKSVDVASLIAFLLLLIFSCFVFAFSSTNLLFLIFVNFWIWFRHRENIKRLWI